MFGIGAQSVKHGKHAGNGLIKGAALVLALCCLAACSKKDKVSDGQSLARVDGQDVTVLQLNSELAQANVPAAQKDVASKKLLDSLIDRQLLEDQATKEKIDRDPVVVAAIERAKAQIIAQAYLQRRLAKVARPTKEEIDKYYLDHPEFFADKKTYEFDQVVLATKDFSPELKALMGSNKSIDDVAAWCKANHVEFVQTAATNSSVDMPPALVKKLREIRKGQLFALQQADRSVIAVIRSVKNDPIKQEVAEQQIGGFLMNQRNKETAEAELTRLRAAAKIEYLNKNFAAPAVEAAPADAKQKKDGVDDHTKRGVADL
ncbi:peptidyl-prolyl cis-trans isomerase C [Oxalobacteraceae bacterium GrIS 2.11]